MEVSDLEITFDTQDGEVRAVNGLSFAVEEGDSLAVVGESGSGKTQAAFAMLGILAKNGRARGSVRFDGAEILNLPEPEMNQIRAEQIAMIFQDPMTSLNPVLTVGRQLVEGIRAHGEVSKAAARERAAGLLAEVGLPDPQGALDRYPHELSGGMRQRVVIAIALGNSPALLIA
ncbi:MAG: ABC transporter ATP-binding protein, partial [Pseudomonadota bacterium]